MEVKIIEMGGRDVRMREDMDWVGCEAKCGTNHLPEIDPAGLPFFGPPPPTIINQKTSPANDQPTKKECLFFI